MAQAVLPGGAYKLFVAMPLGERAHAMCVLRALRRWGINSSDVAQAAVLHDVRNLVLLTGTQIALRSFRTANRHNLWQSTSRCEDRSP